MTTSARTLGTGLGFTEGPLVTEDGELVLVSISQGRLYHINAEGHASVLCELSGGPNGACPGPGGEVYVAQNGGNWMVGGADTRKTESGVQAVAVRDGSMRWVTEKPLAPNDLCFGPDGALYITDPTRRRTYDDGRIWRYDPVADEAEILYVVDWFPNGIAFGLEDDALYVASTGDSRIIRLPLPPSGPAHNGEVFAEISGGHPDGMAFDVEGNLLVGAISHTDDPGTVQVFDRDGRLRERLIVGPNRRYTNLTVTGDGTIIVTDSDGGTVQAIDGWAHPGLALYPRRGKYATEPELAAGLRNIDLMTGGT